MGIPAALYAAGFGLAISGGTYFWPGITIGFVATINLLPAVGLSLELGRSEKGFSRSPVLYSCLGPLHELLFIRLQLKFCFNSR
jgi:hypothetical protein